MILSGIGRFAQLRLTGQTQRQAMGEVLRGFRIVMGGRSCPMLVGAAIPELELKSGPVRLDEETAIRKLTDQEIDLAYGAQFPNASIWAFHQQVFRAQAEGPGLIMMGKPRIITSYWHIDPVMDEEALHQIHSAVALLQLAASDGIRPRRIFTSNATWLPSSYGGIGLLASRQQVYFEPPPLQLRHRVNISVDMAVKLRRLWPKHQAALVDPRYRVASSRYFLSLHRASSGDALIDHWIGLEALFTGHGADIGRIAATKIALLLGRDLSERKAIRTLVLKHYNIRSGLVHGGSVGDRIKGFFKFAAPFMRGAQMHNMLSASLFSRQWLAHCLRKLIERFDRLEELEDVMLFGSLT